MTRGIRKGSWRTARGPLRTRQQREHDIHMAARPDHKFLIPHLRARDKRRHGRVQGLLGFGRSGDGKFPFPWPRMGSFR